MGLYNRIKAERILNRVRDLIDMAPDAGESVEEDFHVLGSGYTQVPDVELRQYLTQAVRDISGRVKAVHIPDLITSVIVGLPIYSVETTEEDLPNYDFSEFEHSMYLGDV